MLQTAPGDSSRAKRERTLEWNLDVAAVAGYNAALAGVLAGLAFTVFLLYLQNKAPENEQIHGGVATNLSVAFLVLIVCAINYGTLTASPSDSPQALLLLAVHVPVFGMAIMLLMYCMALATVGNAVMRGAAKLCSVIVVALGPTIIMLYIMLATYDIHTLRCITVCTEPALTPVYVSTGLSVALAVYGSVLLWWLRYRAPHREATATRYSVVGWMVLWVVVLDFAVHGYLSLRGLTFWADNLTQTITACVMAAALAVFMTLCARVLPQLY